MMILTRIIIMRIVILRAEDTVLHMRYHSSPENHIHIPFWMVWYSWTPELLTSRGYWKITGYHFLSVKCRFEQ